MIVVNPLGVLTGYWIGGFTELTAFSWRYAFVIESTIMMVVVCMGVYCMVTGKDFYFETRDHALDEDGNQVNVACEQAVGSPKKGAPVFLKQVGRLLCNPLYTSLTFGTGAIYFTVTGR